MKKKRGKGAAGLGQREHTTLKKQQDTGTVVRKRQQEGGNSNNNGILGYFDVRSEVVEKHEDTPHYVQEQIVDVCQHEVEGTDGGCERTECPTGQTHASTGRHVVRLSDDVENMPPLSQDVDAGQVVWSADRMVGEEIDGVLGGSARTNSSVPSSISKKRFLGIKPVIQKDETRMDEDLDMMDDVIQSTPRLHGKQREHAGDGVFFEKTPMESRNKLHRLSVEGGMHGKSVSPPNQNGNTPLHGGGFLSKTPVRRVMSAQQKKHSGGKRSNSVALLKCCHALQSKLEALEKKRCTDAREKVDDIDAFLANEGTTIDATSVANRSNIAATIENVVTRKIHVPSATTTGSIATDSTRTVVELKQPATAARPDIVAQSNGGKTDSESTVAWEDDDDDEAMLGALDAVEAAALAQKDMCPTSSHDIVQKADQGLPPRKTIDRKAVRYQITQIEQTTCDGFPVVLLHLKNAHESGDCLTVALNSPWDDGDYRVGDPVNIVDAVMEEDTDGQKHCSLGLNRKGYLIHYPDVLLGGTRVSSASDCPRRGFLGERMTGEGTTAACVKGTMYHTLFQQALSKNLRRAGQLEVVAREIVDSMSEDLVDSELSVEEALQWLRESIPSTLSFLNRFARQDPGPTAVCQTHMPMHGPEAMRACISEVVDIEEYVLAPSYGLKGYVDASVSVKFMESNSNQSEMRIDNQIECYAPLELKTGRPRDSDAAQVLLYLLQMEERYGSAMAWGLLIYKGNPNPTLIRKQDGLVSCLLANRNRLAAALARSELPPLTHMKHACEKCFERSQCMLLHASREQGTMEGFVSGLPKGSATYKILEAAYQLETGHLSASEKKFLAHWDHLLELEAAEGNFKRHEIWSMSGQERERLGRCISDLVLTEGLQAEWNGAKRRGMLYTFEKTDSKKILGCAIPYGEPVMLSIDGGVVGVSRGHLFSITPDRVVVHVDKAIRNNLLFPDGRKDGENTLLADQTLRWRIDREDVGTTAPRMRTFLFSLFEASNDSQLDAHKRNLRKLIVDLEPPRDSFELSADQKRVLGNEVRTMELNEEQTEAVRRAMVARDYTLVLGVPGAGKTTAVISMIRALAQMGKRVLLVSYTNSAVDHVLLKLVSLGFENFVRIGRLGRVHQNLEEFTPLGKKHNAHSPSQMRDLMARVNLVGVSALGTSDALVRNLPFDVCIVDEAGQITLPAVLGPLLRASRFVLVGDHHQLPPLVTCAAAEEGGFGIPLFARLAEAHPQAVVTLSKQYRMAEEIQSIANTFIYSGKLKCGSPAVARSRLALDVSALTQSLQPSLTSQSHDWCWIKQVLNPNNPVVFLDTRGACCRELSRGDAVENIGEATVVLKIVEAALRAGVPLDSISAISPYRSQVSLLLHMATSKGLSLECLTIDKAQGRDKDCVILSLVRSNEKDMPGKLLDDARRVNVGLTRAKSKLILVGDSSTLSNLPLFKQIIDFCDSKHWVVTLVN